MSNANVTAIYNAGFGGCRNLPPPLALAGWQSAGPERAFPRPQHLSAEKLGRKSCRAAPLPRNFGVHRGGCDNVFTFELRSQLVRHGSSIDWACSGLRCKAPRVPAQREDGSGMFACTVLHRMTRESETCAGTAAANWEQGKHMLGTNRRRVGKVPGPCRS